MNIKKPKDDSIHKLDEQSDDYSSLQSPDRCSSSVKTLANVSSNLPRNILKRKQVEKINKKKFENLDSKENNF
jgi:hypothetical protein